MLVQSSLCIKYFLHVLPYKNMILTFMVILMEGQIVKKKKKQAGKQL